MFASFVRRLMPLLVIFLGILIQTQAGLARGEAPGDRPSAFRQI
ncbi:MAG: hypothetical protein ACOVOC_14570 [Rhabdaerophilum sp.]